jgi:hypothetical protein
MKLADTIGEELSESTRAQDAPNSLHPLGVLGPRLSPTGYRKEAVMYEITLNPEDYGLEALAAGLGGEAVSFDSDERRKWANEIGIFAEKLDDLKEKAVTLQHLFSGQDPITATPGSLKSLKIHLFQINDALNNSLEMAGDLENQIVKK